MAIAEISDEHLRFEYSDCPDHMDKRDWESYRVMFSFGGTPEALKRGCPLGRSQRGYGIGDRFNPGAIFDLLFRASLDNPEVVFYYEGEHGSVAVTDGGKTVPIATVRKLLGR